MNGPEHYLAAQRLDAVADTLVNETMRDDRPEPIEWLLGRAQVAATRAQVHATLAGVALALQMHGVSTETEDAAWQEAVS